MWNCITIYTHIVAIGILGVCSTGTGTPSDVSYVERSNKSRQFISPVSVRLLYGENHGITWTDVEKTYRLPPLITHMFMDVLGLDYHYQRQYLFYSGWGSIWRLKINETRNEPSVVVQTAGDAASVAVDWVRDRVYWTNPKTRTVQSADLEGCDHTTIINNTGNLSKHNNIVLDPYKRFLFFAIDGAQFVTSGLDGANMRNVVVEGHTNMRIVSLAIDVHRNRLYVSGRHDFMPYVVSCEYDGSDVKTYDLTNVWWNKFVSIGVFGNQLFWAHQDGQLRDTVWKANITANGSLNWEKEYTSRGTILENETKIWVLKVYHPDVQSVSNLELISNEEISTIVSSSVRLLQHRTTSLLNLTVIYTFFCFYIKYTFV